MKLADVVADGVDYLRACQDKDGGFLGQASPEALDFSNYKIHESPFFTALILHCLQAVPGTVRLRSRATKFLLASRNETWSWNYWLPGSQAAHTQPYPDDLDDTCCALAALSRQNPKLMSGEVLGNLTRHLTDNEVRPGGPYQTWLIDQQAYPVWEDVDLAVNANIGYCLHLQGAHLPGLESYIARLIRSDELVSKYYVGQLPVIYFLSRWYTGSGIARLRSSIKTALADAAYADNPLALALILSSACMLKLSHSRLTLIADQLVSLQNNGRWGATALYHEPLVDGVPHFAGSEALTTAFVLEALTLYSQVAPPALLRPPVASTIRLDTEELPNALRPQYLQFMQRLIAQDSRHEITAMATTTLGMIGRPLRQTITKHLNTASLHGWAAYTIYDDVLDAEIDPKLLGVANVGLRRSLHHFRAALPRHVQFQIFVDQVFSRMDTANLWETTYARANIIDNRIDTLTLPNYRDYSQLAERSVGHQLAATGVLCAFDYHLSSPEQLRLNEYFRHYLIARQLHDDAHDWEADLQAGRLSAVVTLLLEGRLDMVMTRKLSEALPHLRQVFWELTIVQVIERINHHIIEARQALSRVACFSNTNGYAGILDSLQDAVDQTSEQRQTAITFMEHYGRN